MSGVKVGGAWKTPGSVHVKVGGSWKQAATVHCKVGGAWKLTTLGSPPAAPVMGYTSTGVFTVTNPVAGAVYTATNVSGGGTATWNGTANTFTLSSATSRWTVSASWASGAPQSAVDYMERKAYTTHTEQRWAHIGWNYWWPPPTSASCGTWANGDPWCREAVYGWENYQVQDALPSGYSDSGSEWWRVS